MTCAPSRAAVGPWTSTDSENPAEKGPNVRALHNLRGGDLRGTLAALDSAAHELSWDMPGKTRAHP